MQKYQDIVLKQNGTPLQGGTVTVTDTLGGAVSVYSSNVVGINVNPLTTDSMGRFSFYAPDGRYNLVVSFGGATLATISDILLEDPENPNSYTINGGSIDNTPIGNTTPASGKFTSLDATGSVSAGGNVTATGNVSAGGSLTAIGALTTNAIKEVGGRLGVGMTPVYGVDVADVASGSMFRFTRGPTQFGHYISSDIPHIGSLTNHRVAIVTNGLERATFDTVGNQGNGVVPSPWVGGGYIDFAGNGFVGNATAYSVNRMGIGVNCYYGSGAWRYKASSVGANLLDFSGSQFIFSAAASGTANAVITFAQLINTNTNAVTTGANAAASVLVVNRDTTTSRSINASGTINASGADYAEYERNGGLRFAKGDVVGFKADGTLTHTFDEAIRFGVKSTDPSIVGGDVWGSEESLRIACPQTPTFSEPQYTGSPDPGPAPELPANAAQEQQAEHDAAMQAHAAASYAHTIDKAEHDARAHTARHLFDTATWPEYERAKAAFDAALEDARQGVDRIAYAGKVPCNVTGATPGGYIIADSLDGKIVGQFVTKPSFDQYLRAVGRVNRILPDGRCEVAVIVH
jgi:hypothetical protein